MLFLFIETVTLYLLFVEDINVLKRTSFRKLEGLWLDKNLISSILVFDTFTFEQLELLYLNNNRINKGVYPMIIEILKRIKDGILMNWHYVMMDSMLWM